MKVTRRLAVLAISTTAFTLLAVPASAAPCKGSRGNAMQSSRVIHPTVIHETVIHERVVSQPVHQVVLKQAPKDIVDTAVGAGGAAWCHRPPC